MSAAWRELDYEGAEHYLRILARSCPHAAEALYFQTEFPDGVYARVNVGVGSTDELVLALSEATPVLQEGGRSRQRQLCRLGRHQRYRAFPDRRAHPAGGRAGLAV